jgi:alkylation response protein AidB-like acyl-CoA dehydrogenase|tara:strand:- start:1296 stop:2558 length:1263 start_codon:yes stop_codon:yes gene_type:complete
VNSSTQTGTFPEYPTLLKRPISDREVRLLERARTHAADFAERADEHDRNNSFPHENYEAMKESGYAHMTLPEEYGGEGVNLIELCACQEQLAQGCAGTTIGINMHIFGLGSRLVDMRNDTPERQAQGEMMMRMLAESKGILCGSFSETSSPGAYMMPSTVAHKVDGGWLINGTKSYFSNVPAADMIGALVRVEVSDDEPPGVTMVMVPKDNPGVICMGEESWDVIGVRASGSWDVQFKDAFIPDEMMPPVQPANSVFANMSSFGSWFNITISAVYLGVAQAAIDWVKRYLNERKPATEERSLAHMPGLQYQLAEMVAITESSRALIRSSAEDWMAKPWDVQEAMAKGGLCKYVATNNHTKVVELAMDIAGGPSIFRREGLERLYRDARAGKAHPPADMMALESIAKYSLGIPRDFQPRWG